MSEPENPPRLFLSHTRKDSDIVNELYKSSSRPDLTPERVTFEGKLFKNASLGKTVFSQLHGLLEFSCFSSVNSAILALCLYN
jgi:hypothetical protein